MFVAHELAIDVVKQVEVLIAGEELQFLKVILVERTDSFHDLSDVFLDFIIVVSRFVLLFILILLIILELLAYIFDELYDGLEVEIVGAVFDLVVVHEGIVVPQEGFKQLGDTVLDGASFEHFVQDEFSDEFDIG